MDLGPFHLKLLRWIKISVVKLNFILWTSRVSRAASFFLTINWIWLKKTSRKTYSIPFIIVTRGKFVQFLTRGHDIRHNGTQHDGTRHNGQNCKAGWNILRYAECYYIGCYYILLKKTMLSRINRIYYWRSFWKHSYITLIN